MGGERGALMKIVVLHFILPAALSLLFSGADAQEELDSLRRHEAGPVRQKEVCEPSFADL